jgi:DNA-binding transcriptional LysR family regulator
MKQIVPPVDTIDLNAVAVFARVVQARSFTGAAAQLGLPKSAVSRRVAALEQALGARLLHRTTRKLHLTDAGARYYNQAVQALDGLNDAARVLSSEQAEPQGTVRITAPSDLQQYGFAQAISHFARSYPRVRIEIELTTRFVDLVAEGFDLALRGTSTLRDSSLISRRITETPMFLIASPAYVDRHGAPKTPAELALHDCIAYRPQGKTARWPITGPRGERAVEVRARFGVDDVSFAADLARRGSGIAFVPSEVCREDLARGRLVRILPEYRGPLGALFLIYPAARFVPQAVRLLREHLYESLRAAARAAIAPGAERRARA